jgi:hypothetical protein
MDPDAALDEVLAAVDRITQLVEEERLSDQPGAEQILRIAELVAALDGWLTAGGYLPQRWRPAGRRSA